MKDPHVESLVYRAESAEGIVYNNPPAVEIDMRKWEGSLRNGVLTCRMRTHYASISDARREVESYLRAWEISASLKQGKGAIKFVYQDAEVVDLAPQGADAGVVVLGGAAAVATRAIASVQISRKNYPPPPKNFVASPDVETLWRRYEGYLDGKEPLQSMAYFCLTMVERIHGGQQKEGEKARKAAARTLKVDFEVLNTLGKFTSEKGDGTTARKFLTQPSPLTGKECAWIESVVKELIYRVGEYSGRYDNSAFPQITMANLPPIK